MRLIPFVLLGLTLAACRREPPPPPPPIENALVVSVEIAPALPEAEDDEPATIVLRKGRVLTPGRTLHRVKWSGIMLEQKFDRDAEMLEVRLSPKGTYTYLFSPDVGEQSVPATKLFCATKPPQVTFTQPCEDILQRFVLGGDEALAFHPCGTGPCPVSFAKGGRATWSSVEGMSDIYPATLGTKKVLIATTNYVTSLAETGRRIVVLTADPAMSPLGEISMDEIDSRQNVVKTRTGIVTVRGDALEMVGTRRDVDKVTSKEVSTAPIRETYKLGPNGKLAKQ